MAISPSEAAISPITLSRCIPPMRKARILDEDGNDYIDYMCGYGPNVLGYCDEDVDKAALAQLKKENCVTHPSSIMVDFAELLVDTVAFR